MAKFLVIDAWGNQTIEETDGWYNLDPEWHHGSNVLCVVKIDENRIEIKEK